MGDRDRLIELILSCERVDLPLPIEYQEHLADYLLASGVILPKYNIGDTVWYITGLHRTIVKSAIVEEIIINSNGVSDLYVKNYMGRYFENSVEIFYSTKEEAEKALEGMKNA